MRHLAQPVVLKSAALAALVTTLASYPSIVFWLKRPEPIWYLEAMIFFCCMVLWGFVFAWHTVYAHRPLWVLKPEPGPFLAVTALAAGTAAVFHWFIDPALRPLAPEEYPGDLKHWFAAVLFALFFNRLFLLFAPFAWLVRLLKNPRVAAGLTVLFGAVVLTMKVRALATPVPPALFAALLIGRVVMGFLAVWFYLRGGVILIWWWTLLFEARHLVNFE